MTGWGGWRVGVGGLGGWGGGEGGLGWRGGGGGGGGGEPAVIILCIGYIQEQYSSAMRGKKALGLQGSKCIQLSLAEDIQTVQEDQSS